MIFINLRLSKLLLLVKNHNKKFELAGFLQTWSEIGKKENIFVRKRNKKFRLAGFFWTRSGNRKQRPFLALSENQVMHFL